MAEEYWKTAEHRIQTWLDRPADGYSMHRIYDQLSGYYIVSRNISDFYCYKFPYFYFIESKATLHDRFDFSELRDNQRNGMRLNAEIQGCYGLVVVLFVEYKRAFIFNIKDIADINPDIDDKADNKTFLKIKSVNIKKIAKWKIPYWEIETIPSRKGILEYTGDLPDFEETK